MNIENADIDPLSTQQFFTRRWNRAMHHLNRGFTLIELLVVISIIALLVSILLPVLQDVRAAARFLQCGTQIRQLYLGVSLYADDHDSIIPYEFNGNSTQAASVSPPEAEGFLNWYERLDGSGGKFEYLAANNADSSGNTNDNPDTVFRCPLAPDDLNYDLSRSPTTYAININLYGRRVGSTGAFQSGRKLKRIESQISNTLVLADAPFPATTFHPSGIRYNDSFGDNISDATQRPYGFDETTGQANNDLHNGAIQTVSIDGHVKGMNDWSDPEISIRVRQQVRD